MVDKETKGHFEGCEIFSNKRGDFVVKEGAKATVAACKCVPLPSPLKAPFQLSNS